MECSPLSLVAVVESASRIGGLAAALPNGSVRGRKGNLISLGPNDAFMHEVGSQNMRRKYEATTENDRQILIALGKAPARARDASALMRIGIDFDNTIVSYDALFYRAALEKSLIPVGLPQSALVSRLLREWQRGCLTKNQGLYLWARMGDAATYPGAIEFAYRAGAGFPPAIVSHKTKHPFLGPQ
jgi:hypothetical protein